MDKYLSDFGYLIDQSVKLISGAKMLKVEEDLLETEEVSS